jgi:hypothetical protein
MQAMTLMLPPQTLQTSMSILNTRFKRCALLIAPWLEPVLHILARALLPCCLGHAAPASLALGVDCWVRTHRDSASN